MVSYSELYEKHYNILQNNNLCIKNTFIDSNSENVYEQSLTLRKTKSLNNLQFEKVNINLKELYNQYKNEYMTKFIKVTKELMLFVDIYIIKENIYDKISSYIENIRNTYSNIIQSSYNDKRIIARTLSCMNKNMDNTIRKHMLNIRNFVYENIIHNYNILEKEKNLDIHINEELIFNYKNNVKKITIKTTQNIELI
jgi:hypothetical protein